MAAIWVLKSHILPYKLIELSDFGDFCVVSYDLDLDEANGAKIIIIKIMCDTYFSYVFMGHRFFSLQMFDSGSTSRSKV